jgi:Putative prokaryotic signal transducing protein
VASDCKELFVSDEIIVLRTYGNELDARFAATVLEANGIPAQVAADTAGGAYPSLALLFPVRLLVRAHDAADAAEILDTPADEASENDPATLEADPGSRDHDR